jgi:hypothetical protein
MAADYFGKSVGIWHQRLLKITQHESKMLGYDVGAQWEWLGKELGG